jgi:hypothetical protein
MDARRETATAPRPATIAMARAMPLNAPDETTDTTVKLMKTAVKAILSAFSWGLTADPTRQREHSEFQSIEVLRAPLAL